MAMRQPSRRRRSGDGTRKREPAGERKGRQQLLRSWHRWIAASILMRQFRAPEISGGPTALRCQCLELARAEDPRGRGRGGGCALHQDALGRAWIRAVHGGTPLVCGAGEILVPTLSAGDSGEVVMQYARWRRSVWMPTRFYVESAAGRRHGLDDTVSQ
ncbi:hypothetical protein BAE44_0013110 [Dichanthelium oligosanthes]|uniref:Uncharacterized protein n=1 Tax=Dichanthelium oligosanthes TaxID=888268 RepID=A0A1E5VLC4_9POAL|nr:hypothetical protein BAE44_0013110 [Dichanthelium oligosanthes]